MVFIGMELAKDKHDYFIISLEGEILKDAFTIEKNKEGFGASFQAINICTGINVKIKVELEAIEHYSYNILGFRLNNGLPTYLINHLHTNLYRKSLSLRKNKTDRVATRMDCFYAYV